MPSKLGKTVIDSYFFNPQRLLPYSSDPLLAFITRRVIVRLQTGPPGKRRLDRTCRGRRSLGIQGLKFDPLVDSCAEIARRHDELAGGPHGQGGFHHLHRFFGAHTEFLERSPETRIDRRVIVKPPYVPVHAQPRHGG